MNIKDKISFAINQIPINNFDGSANENAIKAVRYLQEVHEALSQHDVNQQRELLLAWEKSQYIEAGWNKSKDMVADKIDKYLANNCG